MKDLITISEAAKLIGVSHNTVWKWLQNGKVPYLVIGSRKRISRRTAEALAAGEFFWQHGNKKK